MSTVPNPEIYFGGIFRGSTTSGPNPWRPVAVFPVCLGGKPTGTAFFKYCDTIDQAITERQKFETDGAIPKRYKTDFAILAFKNITPKMLDDAKIGLDAAFTMTQSAMETGLEPYGKSMNFVPPHQVAATVQPMG